jgi:RNA polymerase sigma factor (sigma-70 family)
MSAHALPSPRSGLRRLRPLARRSDDELRALAASGDAGAFAELYERHHQVLYRYCRSIVRHDEDARDALHSTWTNAWAALRSADRDVPVRPWLFRIAHNEAVSVLRRRRDHDDLDEVAGAAGAGSVEDDVALRERLATLHADLAELPERQRSALLLRELSGLGHDEIATVFGVSPSAAKQSIYEARRALHEAEEGRSMICTDVQRLLSDGDGRVRRGRKLRAHLRTCDACAGFDAALRRRPADIALLAPPLPAAAAAGVLAPFLAHAGGSGHGGGALAAGTAATSAGPAAVGGAGTLGAGSASSGLLAAGSKLGAGLAAKLAVGAAVVAGAGAGTVQLATHGRGSAAPPAEHAPAAGAKPGAVAPAAASGSAAGSATSTGSGAQRGSARQSGAGNGSRAGRDSGHGKHGHAGRGADGDHGRSAAGNGAAGTGGQGDAHRSDRARSGSDHAGAKTKAHARHPHRRATAKRAPKKTRPAHAPKAAKPVAPAPASKPSTTSGSGTTTHTGSKPAESLEPTTTDTSGATAVDPGTTSTDATTPEAGASSAREVGRTSTSPKS